MHSTSRIDRASPLPNLEGAILTSPSRYGESVFLREHKPIGIEPAALRQNDREKDKEPSLLRLLDQERASPTRLAPIQQGWTSEESDDALFAEAVHQRFDYILRLWTGWARRPDWGANFPILSGYEAEVAADRLPIPALLTVARWLDVDGYSTWADVLKVVRRHIVVESGRPAMGPHASVGFHGFLDVCSVLAKSIAVKFAEPVRQQILYPSSSMTAVSDNVPLLCLSPHYAGEQAPSSSSASRVGLLASPVRHPLQYSPSRPFSSSSETGTGTNAPIQFQQNHSSLQKARHRLLGLLDELLKGKSSGLLLYGLLTDETLQSSLSLPTLEVLEVYQLPLMNLHEALADIRCQDAGSVGVILAHMLLSGQSNSSSLTGSSPFQSVVDGGRLEDVCRALGTQTAQDPCKGFAVFPTDTELGHNPKLNWSYNRYCETIAVAATALSRRNPDEPIPAVLQSRNALLYLLQQVFGSPNLPVAAVAPRIKSGIERLLAEQREHKARLANEFSSTLQRIYLYYCGWGDLQGSGLLTYRKFLKFLNDISPQFQGVQLQASGTGRREIPSETERGKLADVYFAVARQCLALDPDRYQHLAETSQSGLPNRPSASPSLLSSSSFFGTSNESKTTKQIAEERREFLIRQNLSDVAIQQSFEMSFILFVKVLEALSLLRFGFDTNREALATFVAQISPLVGMVSAQVVASVSLTDLGEPKLLLSQPETQQGLRRAYEGYRVPTAGVKVPHPSLPRSVEGRPGKASHDHVYKSFTANSFLTMLKEAELIPTYLTVPDAFRALRFELMNYPCPYPYLLDDIPFNALSALFIRLALMLQEPHSHSSQGVPGTDPSSAAGATHFPVHKQLGVNVLPLHQQSLTHRLYFLFDRVGILSKEKLESRLRESGRRLVLQPGASSPIPRSKATLTPR
jgi:hypothetical protein